MFKQVIEVSSSNVNGYIKTVRDEDYDPELAQFDGHILGVNVVYYNTKMVKTLLDQVQALYDQMNAIDVASILTHEELKEEA